MFPLPLAQVADPADTALLIIDMQNDFCHGNGFYGRRGVDMAGAQAAAGPLRRLLAGARAAAVPVVWVLTLHSEWTDSPAWDARLPSGPDRQCRPDSWGAQLVEGLEPAAGEYRLTKHRYSAFFQTDLELVLRSRGVRNVVVTGVKTNVCVDATVRDALFRDMNVVICSDATATDTDELQQIWLETLGRYFGTVARAGEILQVWARATERK